MFNPENWSVLARRIIGVILGIINLGLIIFGYGTMWVGKFDTYRPLLLKLVIPVGVANILLIGVAVGESEQNYLKGFLVALGLVLMMVIMTIFFGRIVE